MKRGGIHLAVIDSDILHIRAIELAVDRTVLISRHRGGSGGFFSDEVSAADAVLLGVDSTMYCCRRLLVRLNELRGGKAVILYSGFEHSRRAFCGDAPVLGLEELTRELASFEVFMEKLEVPEQYFSASPDMRDDLFDRIGSLSPREFDVFCLSTKGQGAGEMAEIFGCSVSTVETHLRHVRSKMQAANGFELRQIGIRLMQSGYCRAFSYGEGHICPERSASLGSCPYIRSA